MIGALAGGVLLGTNGGSLGALIGSFLGLRSVASQAASGVTAIAVGILLQATTYTWYLSMDYGPGSDQQSRMGYTMKNVQRIPADTPEQAGTALAAIFEGETLAAPADPGAAAVLAPLASAQDQVLLYGGSDAAPDLEPVCRLVAGSSIAVVVADTEPACALPAAYAATQFRLPLVPLGPAGDILSQCPRPSRTRCPR